MSVTISIYARFDNEADLADWVDSHIMPETIPNGGPVFSWSNEDESGYRDTIIELVGALAHAIREAEANALYAICESDGDGKTHDLLVANLAKDKAALTKAREQMK